MRKSFFYEAEGDMEYIMYLEMQSKNMDGDSPKVPKNDEKDYFGLQVVKKEDPKKPKSDFNPFPFMDKESFDKLRNFAIETNAEVVSRAAKTFEDVAKVELPDLFTDGEKIKQTSRNIFSDESLSNL